MGSKIVLNHLVSLLHQEGRLELTVNLVFLAGLAHKFTCLVIVAREPITGLRRNNVFEIPIEYSL